MHETLVAARDLGGRKVQINPLTVEYDGVRVGWAVGVVMDEFTWAQVRNNPISWRCRGGRPVSRPRDRS